MTESTGIPVEGSVDVLFVAYGGGHISMVIPVADALRAQGVRVCLFALTTAIPHAKASGLPWFSYADLPQALDPLAQGYGRKIAALMSPHAAIPQAQTESYLGVNMVDLVTQYSIEQADQLFEANGRAAFFPINTMTALLQNLRPRVVVATNSPRSERAAITSARTLGIPSVCIVDLFALQAVDWLASAEYANTYCVLNDRVRDLFVRKGAPADAVIVTGNPAFDMLQDPKTRAAGAVLRKARGWGKGRKTILYASSPETPFHATTGEPSNLELPRMIEARLLDIVANDTSLELVVRRHPSEDASVATGPSTFQSPVTEPLDALLHAVDVVVVTASTVGFQGYLAGRPVLSIECSAVSPNAPYGAFGISRAVTNLDDISSGLRQCLNKECSLPSQANLAQAVPSVVGEIKRMLGWMDS